MKLKQFILSEFEMNSYLLIKEKDAILIDVGFEPAKIEEYLRINNLNLKAILLTHAHLDHIGGLNHIKDAFNVPVYVHKLEQKWLIDPSLNGSKSYPYFGDVICRPATNIIDEGETIKIGEFTISIIHTPGHTPGGLCYHIDSWIFTGDTLFYNSIGRTDLYGGDSKLLIKSIKEKLFILPDRTIIYPGHGEKSTIGEEKKTNPYC